MATTPFERDECFGFRERIVGQGEAERDAVHQVAGSGDSARKSLPDFARSLPKLRRR